MKRIDVPKRKQNVPAKAPTGINYGRLSLAERIATLIGERNTELMVTATYLDQDDQEKYLFDFNKCTNLTEIMEYANTCLLFMESGEDEETVTEKFAKQISDLIEKRQEQVRRGAIPQTDSLVFMNENLGDIATEELLKIQLETATRKATHNIKCTSSRCTSMNVLFIEKYTRSGDEASVQYYQCVRCQHEWKK